MECAFYFERGGRHMEWGCCFEDSAETQSHVVLVCRANVLSLLAELPTLRVDSIPGVCTPGYIISSLRD
jgi:hypothetical protein